MCVCEVGWGWCWDLCVWEGVLGVRSVAECLTLTMLLGSTHCLELTLTSDKFETLGSARSGATNGAYFFFKEDRPGFNIRS